jgi:hypothetical protein
MFSELTVMSRILTSICKIQKAPFESTRERSEIARHLNQNNRCPATATPSIPQSEVGAKVTVKTITAAFFWSGVSVEPTP